MKILISIVIAIMVIVVAAYLLTTGSNKSDNIVVNVQNYEQVIADLIQSGKTPDICEKVTYSLDDIFWLSQEVKPKDICYRDFAVARKDPTICNDTFYKEGCLKAVTGVKDETVDWQIYRNEEYGFEFKYSTSTNISYEGKTEFALQPLKVDFGSFLITVWDNPGKLRIKDYFLQNSACTQNKPTCEYFSQGYSLESVEVGSRWGWTTEVGVKSQFFVYLFAAGKEYSIVEFLNRWPDDVEKTKVFNQMLSTFRFLE